MRSRAQHLTLAALAGLLCLAGAGSAAQAARVTGHTAPNVRLGIDVSSWQPNTNWTKVAGANIDFAIVKATESTNYTNPFYATDRAQANANGLVVGAYAYAQPGGSSPQAAATNARKQAQYFLSVAQPRPGDLVPTIDIETTNGLGPNKLTAWLQSWIGTVRNTIGVQPMIYVSPNFWINQLDDTQVFASAGVPLWIANWRVPAPAVPAGNWAGHGYQIWQWTDDQPVPGVNGGPADADQSRGVLAPVKIPVRPTLFKHPRISGTVADGSQLSVSTGSWAGSQPMTYTYRWQRCDTSGLTCTWIAGAHSSTYTVKPGDIWHSLRVQVIATNAAGIGRTRPGPTVRVPDDRAPSAPVLSRPRHAVQTTNSFAVDWSATDVGSGISHYAVRKLVGTPGAGFGAWKVVSWAVAGTSLHFANRAAGSTFCFEVAAYDRAGNTSGWGNQRCTTIPMDDTVLTPHGGWQRTAVAGAYLGTLSRTTTNGATLATGTIHAGQIVLVVKTCPTCGRLAVDWNGARLATYDLASGSAHQQVLLSLPAFASAETGKLVLTAVVAGGRPVSVDGLAVIP